MSSKATQRERTKGIRVSLTTQKPVEADVTLTPTGSKEVRMAFEQVRDEKTRPWEQVKKEKGGFELTD